MLATMLHAAGLRVGHYTSPHILRFNERVWIDGEEASDSSLEQAHEKLRMWLPSEMAEALSYFEYTTLLALVAFEGCDVIVLEAGLGGEFDATNVVPKGLSVVTPIGLDHQAFLGDEIESIAATKLRSIDKRALLAPQPYEEVYEVAARIAADKGAVIYRTEEVIEEREREGVATVAERMRWPSFLRQNAETAVAAYRLSQRGEASWEALKRFKLRGRFERIGERVILDVGHNPLGAQAVAEALKGERRLLVYNALADKDVEGVLSALKPIARRLEVIEIDDERAMDRRKLLTIAHALGYEVGAFDRVSPDSDYLVFGSFHVAEAFLRRIEEVG